MDAKMDYGLGDKVFCQNNTGVEDFIKKWSVYTISAINYQKGIKVEVIDDKGNRHYFKPYRFIRRVKGFVG